ncbi:methyltransferase domain-containing protein [Natronincola peptidivorans]|nr:methyltransferase domain-containing protein [Natronincola peptidivorans]
MGFYQEFSKYYDIVFPMGNAQLEFIRKRTSNPKGKILDIACGTGNYALALAEKGFFVAALDLDTEMIKQLEDKVKAKGLALEALTGDMKTVKNHFKEGSFDTVFCIGNSLVHLTKLEEIQQALDQMYSILKVGGYLILQIINYDRITKYNIDGLPTIENKDAGVKFIRKYKYEEEKKIIHFNTELVVAQENTTKTYSNSVPLYPLQSQQLMGMLQTAGFQNIQLYGSFLEEEYREESYATVVAAEK